MKTTHPYLVRFHFTFGRSRKISREGMAQQLVDMAKYDGLRLRDYAGWYGVRDDADLTTIAAAVANRVHGITLVTIGGNVRDIQYDEPGRMAPAQQGAITFVSEDLARPNTMPYLRRNASSRVVIVTGARISLPTDPESETESYTVQCDDGHRWQIPGGDHEPTLDRCPQCGEYWQ